jgi:hypothetical protein
LPDGKRAKRQVEAEAKVKAEVEVKIEVEAERQMGAVKWGVGNGES